MNKQFLSLLLLASFVPATVVANPFVIAATALTTSILGAGAGLGLYNRKAVQAPVVNSEVAQVVTQAPMVAPEVVNQSLLDVQAAALEVAKQQGFSSVEAMETGIKAIQEEVAARTAKEVAFKALPFYSREKLAAAYDSTKTTVGGFLTSGYNKSVELSKAGYNKSVEFSKAAYASTKSAGKSVVTYAVEHPKTTTAVVVGAAGLSYLAYKGYNKYFRTVKPVAAVEQQEGVPVEMMQRAVRILCAQTPGQGFYKAGDFKNVRKRQFFFGPFAVDKALADAADEAVTCSHALNYIKNNNQQQVDTQEIATIKARLVAATAMLNSKGIIA